ncbi:MAG: hypothetical protein EA382_02860, partial [Spirochaetaceae bacterium]
MSEQSVGVLGVGRLGSDVAFTLAERDLCDIVLCDTDRERAEYLASDLTDTSFGHIYNRRVSWVDDISGLAQCSVVLIAAGARRQPGATTGELFDQNRRVAREVADALVGSSALFVVATEPVDLMTAELARLLRLPPSRVMGIGGVVDSLRVRSALGETLSVGPDYIRAHVVGPHSSEAVIVWDYSSINGIPVRSIAAAADLEAIEATFRSESDARLAQMNESFSRYTPAMACLELLRSIVKDDRRVLSVTIPWVDVLGISGVAMGVPAVIGRFGAERPV